MKSGVPALNVVVSVLYILLAGMTAYWLKLSHKRRIDFQSSSPASVSSLLKQLNLSKIFAISWLKKYTLPGAVFNNNRKFLITELFIISIYAVTCLKINRIILWPVAFITFLLPLVFVVMEIAVVYLEDLMGKEKRNENQTINNMHENEIQIEAVNIETLKPITVLSSNGSNVEVQVFKDRSIVEIGFVSMLTFITFVLLYQTVFTLTNSISNSGQLNISSLLLIILIDQLAVRCSAGLLTFAVLKLLEHKQMIVMAENKLVNWLCHEQIATSMIALQRERLRKQLQHTSSPLKHNSNELFRLEEIKQDCTSSENNQFLNLMNLQPETIQPQTLQANREDPHEEDQLEKEVYLTTPQKQLFQGNEAEDSPRRSILHTIIDNKENETLNNDLNKSTVKSQEQSKNLQEVISKDDPLGDIENFRNDFHLQNSRYHAGRKGKGKKAARRVLKLTGNSPYLQYLPNMLKNIDKVKHAQKDKKML